MNRSDSRLSAGVQRSRYEFERRREGRTNEWSSGTQTSDGLGGIKVLPAEESVVVKPDA